MLVTWCADGIGVKGMGCNFLRPLTFILLIASIGATANAQTTQPSQSPSGWQDCVDRLSDALRGKDLKSLGAVLDRGPVIRTFGSDMLQPPERLLGSTTGAKVLGQHTYLKLPSTLATDLAEDFKTADVPETLRGDFIVNGADAERTANEVAARWLTHLLGPGNDSPFAVIVLWRQERSDTFQNTASRRPVFLLVRGEFSEGQYVVRQIVYGDPLDRPR
jgi:hypothetical protein